MKAQELKIGNYYDHNGEIRKVTPSTIEEVWNSERNWCKPIPLTEEWLLNFGFKKVVNNWYNIHAKDNTFNVYLFENSGYRVEIVSQSIGVFNHVHELQNLYFALTKTELQWQNLEN